MARLSASPVVFTGKFVELEYSKRAGATQERAWTRVLVRVLMNDPAASASASPSDLRRRPPFRLTRLDELGLRPGAEGA